MIELGSRGKDRVSGYEGIVIGKTEWLTGCDRYIIQGPVKDGKRPDAESFDEAMIEIIQTPEQTGIRAYPRGTADAKPQQEALPGGPAPAVANW